MVGGGVGSAGAAAGSKSRFFFRFQPATTAMLALLSVILNSRPTTSSSSSPSSSSTTAAASSAAPGSTRTTTAKTTTTTTTTAKISSPSLGSRASAPTLSLWRGLVRTPPRSSWNLFPSLPMSEKRLGLGSQLPPWLTGAIPKCEVEQESATSMQTRRPRKKSTKKLELWWQQQQQRLRLWGNTPSLHQQHHRRWKDVEDFCNGMLWHASREVTGAEEAPMVTISVLPPPLSPSTEGEPKRGSGGGGGVAVKPRRKPTIKDKQQDEDKSANANAEPQQNNNPDYDKAITQPFLPQSNWDNLTGFEFYNPQAVDEFCQSGLQLIKEEEGGNLVEWEAADKTTTQMLRDAQQRGLNPVDLLVEEEMGGSHHTNDEEDEDEEEKLNLQRQDSASRSEAGSILVWTAKCDEGCVGSELPIVKTQFLVKGMTPHQLSELLMDSERVRDYNKFSIGRTDEAVLGHHDDKDDDGNKKTTKIVRNRTKPPLTSGVVEFVTMMHSRPLSETTNGGEDESPSSCVAISRAVNAGPWKDNGGDEDNKVTRSEILLGINYFRSVASSSPQPLTEVITVTHVKSPSVPTMLATRIGIKGAMDFARDIRSVAASSGDSSSCGTNPGKGIGMTQGGGKEE